MRGTPNRKYYRYIRLEYEKLLLLEREQQKINLFVSVIFTTINFSVFLKKLAFLNENTKNLDSLIEIVALVTCIVSLGCEIIGISLLKEKNKLKNKIKKAKNDIGDDPYVSQKIDKILQSLEKNDELKLAASYLTTSALAIFVIGCLFSFTQVALKDFGWNKLNGKFPLSMDSIISSTAFIFILTSSILLLCSTIKQNNKKDNTQNDKQSQNNSQSNSQNNGQNNGQNNKKDENKKSTLPVTLAGLSVALSSFGLIARIIEGFEATETFKIGTDTYIFSIGYLLATLVSATSLCISIYDFIKAPQPGKYLKDCSVEPAFTEQKQPSKS